MNRRYAHPKLHLIDTSALARIRNPQVQKVIGALIAERAAATCITIDLEMGITGRTQAGVQKVARRRRAQFTNLVVNETIADRARAIQQALALRGHQAAVGPADLITAAVAEYYGAVIVHYDSDFEHVAAVTRQPHIWVVPRGSID